MSRSISIQGAHAFDHLERDRGDWCGILAALAISSDDVEHEELSMRACAQHTAWVNGAGATT